MNTFALFVVLLVQTGSVFGVFFTAVALAVYETSIWIVDKLRQHLNIVLACILIVYVGTTLVYYQEEIQTSVDIGYECYLYRGVHAVDSYGVAYVVYIGNVAVEKWNSVVLYLRAAISDLIDTEEAISDRGSVTGVFETIQGIYQFGIECIYVLVNDNELFIEGFTPFLESLLNTVTCPVGVIVNGAVSISEGQYEAEILNLVNSGFTCVYNLADFITLGSVTGGPLRPFLKSFVANVQCIADVFLNLVYSAVNGTFLADVRGSVTAFLACMTNLLQDLTVHEFDDVISGLVQAFGRFLYIGVDVLLSMVNQDFFNNDAYFRAYFRGKQMTCPLFNTVCIQSFNVNTNPPCPVPHDFERELLYAIANLINFVSDSFFQGDDPISGSGCSNTYGGSGDSVSGDYCQANWLFDAADVIGIILEMWKRAFLFVFLLVESISGGCSKDKGSVGDYAGEMLLEVLEQPILFLDGLFNIITNGEFTSFFSWLWSQLEALVLETLHDLIQFGEDVASSVECFGNSQFRDCLNSWPGSMCDLSSCFNSVEYGPFVCLQNASFAYLKPLNSLDPSIYSAATALLDAVNLVVCNFMGMVDCFEAIGDCETMCSEFQNCTVGNNDLYCIQKSFQCVEKVTLFLWLGYVGDKVFGFINTVFADFQGFENDVVGAAACFGQPEFQSCIHAYPTGATCSIRSCFSDYAFACLENGNFGFLASWSALYGAFDSVLGVVDDVVCPFVTMTGCFNDLGTCESEGYLQDLCTTSDNLPSICCESNPPFSTFSGLKELCCAHSAFYCVSTTVPGGFSWMGTMMMGVLTMIIDSVFVPLQAIVNTADAVANAVEDTVGCLTQGCSSPCNPITWVEDFVDCLKDVKNNDFNDLRKRDGASAPGSGAGENSTADPVTHWHSYLDTIGAGQQTTCGSILRSSHPLTVQDRRWASHNPSASFDMTYVLCLSMIPIGMQGKTKRSEYDSSLMDLSTMFRRLFQIGHEMTMRMGEEQSKRNMFRQEPRKGSTWKERRNAVVGLLNIKSSAQGAPPSGGPHPPPATVVGRPTLMPLFARQPVVPRSQLLGNELVPFGTPDEITYAHIPERRRRGHAMVWWVLGNAYNTNVTGKLKANVPGFKRVWQPVDAVTGIAYELYAIVAEEVSVDHNGRMYARNGDDQMQGNVRGKMRNVVGPYLSAWESRAAIKRNEADTFEMRQFMESTPFTRDRFTPPVVIRKAEGARVGSRKPGMKESMKRGLGELQTTDGFKSFARWVQIKYNRMHVLYQQHGMEKKLVQGGRSLRHVMEQTGADEMVPVKWAWMLTGAILRGDSKSVSMYARGKLQYSTGVGYMSLEDHASMLNKRNDPTGRFRRTRSILPVLAGISNMKAEHAGEYHTLLYRVSRDTLADSDDGSSSTSTTNLTSAVGVLLQQTFDNKTPRSLPVASSVTLWLADEFFKALLGVGELFTSLYHDLANTVKHTDWLAFAIRTENYLIRLVTCTVPQDYDGTNPYNPFCIPLLPEKNLFALQTAFPNSVFPLQIPWWQAMIATNCTNTVDPGYTERCSDPFDSNCDFKHVDDNCDREDGQDRPLCHSGCQYCRRTYHSCLDLGFTDGFDTLVFALNALPKLYNRIWAVGLFGSSIYAIRLTLIVAVVGSFVAGTPTAIILFIYAYLVYSADMYAPLLLLPIWLNNTPLFYTAFGSMYLSFFFPFPAVPSTFNPARAFSSAAHAISGVYPLSHFTQDDAFWRSIETRSIRFDYGTIDSVPSEDIFCSLVTVSNAALLVLFFLVFGGVVLLAAKVALATFTMAYSMFLVTLSFVEGAHTNKEIAKMKMSKIAISDPMPLQQMLSQYYYDDADEDDEDEDADYEDEWEGPGGSRHPTAPANIGSEVSNFGPGVGLHSPAFQPETTFLYDNDQTVKWSEKPSFVYLTPPMYPAFRLGQNTFQPTPQPPITYAQKQTDSTAPINSPPLVMTRRLKGKNSERVRVPFKAASNKNENVYTNAMQADKALNMAMKTQDEQFPKDSNTLSLDENDSGRPHVE